MKLRSLLQGLLFCSPCLVFAAQMHIYEHRTDQLLLCTKVQDAFELSFVHSVSLTPVVDYYRVDTDGRITQTREDFITHGQGLPSLNNEPDATDFVISKDGYSLYLKRPINTLIVQTDQRFKNRLHIDGRTINLNRWPDTGLRLSIHAKCNDTDNN